MYCNICKLKIEGLVSVHAETHGFVWYPNVRKWFRITNPNAVGVNVRWTKYRQRLNPNQGSAIDTRGRLKADGAFVKEYRSVIEQILMARGLDPFTCTLCRKPTHQKCDIHHTKYQGATINDLVFACRKCNTQQENRGLA
jgi:5-methylcytosine-specific restriction endonuclease McrA